MPRTEAWDVQLAPNMRFGEPPRVRVIEDFGESTLQRFARVYRLSPQETRLVLLAVREVPNKQTADKLGCGECTVRTHWHRIFKKVGCTSQRDLLARLFQFAEERRLESAVCGSRAEFEKRDASGPGETELPPVHHDHRNG